MYDKKKHNYVTDGSILKSIIKLSLPIVVANVLQSVYNLTDMFWVGRLGKEAVAAVSFSFPILFLLISAGAGISVAGTILVAQYRGKRDRESVDFIAAQTLFMVTVLSVVISAAGYFLAEPIIYLAGAEPDVAPMAVAYLKISFVGLFFLFSFFVCQSLLWGVGVVKLPMAIVFVTVLLNFAADPLFIMGWGFIPALGVSGAALATILTQGLASLAAFAMFVSGRYGISLKLRNLPPDWRLIKKTFVLGLPASVEHSIRAGSFAVMVFLVGTFGTVAVASYGIVTRIMSFIIIPAVGMAMAVTTLVGQNMGAGKIRRAEDISLLSSAFAFVLMTAAGLLFFVFSRRLMAFFIPGNSSVIESGSVFLRITSLTFGFIGFQIVLGGAFRGSGETLSAMMLTLFSFLFLRVLLAWLLPAFTHLAENGIWLAFPVSNVLGGAAALLLFLKGNWKKKRITEEFRAAVFADSAASLDVPLVE